LSCYYSQDLLDKGAPKNLPNSLGWTPLHEACFYNRIETVKVLLLSGANSSLRTESGGLPYHLAGLQTIRDMIKDMGCQGSLPKNDRDTVDMMTILQELTFSATERNGPIL
jgi:ankyrin repeat protein